MCADHGSDEHFKRVRERLQRATETADRPTDTQLNSITVGVFGEQRGDPAHAPKRDRIAEIAEKLDGLAAEASGETVDHVLTARDRWRDGYWRYSVHSAAATVKSSALA